MKDVAMKESTDSSQTTPHVVARIPIVSLASHLSSFILHPSSLILYPPSWFFLVIWLALLVAGRSDMLRDPGTFWHVAAGDRMLASGQVIREDPFSFTRGGRPWVADQWLAECVMAIVHRWADWDGLLLVAAALLAGVYAWIGARLLRGGLHWLPTVLLLGVAMLIGAPQFHVRPLVATIVLLGVTFGWLVDVENGRRRLGQLWWLVPLFILWTNVHGGVLGGLGTVGLCLGGWCLCAIVGALRDRNHRAEDSRRLTAAGAAAIASRGPLAPDYCDRRRLGLLRCLVTLIAVLMAVAATVLVSPYGLASPREWLDTLAMPLPKFISEHAPLDLTDPFGLGALALVAGYLVTLIGVFPQRPRITWLVPLVWFVLALSRLRNAPLFGVTALIALADMLPYSRVGRWLARRDLLTGITDSSVREGGGGRFDPLVLPAIVVAAALLLQIGRVPVPVVGHGWARFDPERCPIDLLPKLEEINRSSPEGTRIFNDLNFGGFLIYHAPRLRIFVDDRCPLYGTDFLLACEHARCKDPAQIDRWRRQYGFNYALVESDSRLLRDDRRLLPIDSPFDRYLSQSPDWSLVQRSVPAALYRHK
jgi:hypothetical protein